MPQISNEIADPGWFESQRRRVFHLLRTKLGVDRPIAFTVLARVWASFAGLATLILIAHFLTPAEQGYYYTFGSLVALQIVFELGFSFVILQLASHERAHLTISSAGEISGDKIAHARLASILQKAVRWYSSAAILLAIFLILAGSHFFLTHSQTATPVHWRLPWYATAIAAAITFQLDPVLSFMEGCGYVANIARVRFGQVAIGNALAWIALISHRGLFTPAMMILGNICVSGTWLFRRRRLLLGLLRYRVGLHRIHWGSEVWSFQWRIAVSWLCGYFIFQLYNPVLFAYQGAVAAGQMGMSLSLASAIQSISISWMNTKAAPFGSMIARKEYAQLDHVFFRTLTQSFTVCAVGSALAWGIAIYLNWAHLRIANRILSPSSLGILLIGTMLNNIVFAQALYLRAHKQEKFLLNSVLGAVLVGCSTYFLGRAYGAFGMVTGTLMVGLLMGLPLGTYTFFKYRRLWHAQ
ncbi:hypothetical protein [Alloacidobacterium sp.]|uniref:hypothetical protein n=1 Tax=Alloacidobacterium sp. TaxID=2951999 RepID=UPI002D58D648|nr:hypothetical protein [Alloacidobacterium sp.]HYK37955.1 hypothetical protein [Alloacidobacterium sp.]